MVQAPSKPLTLEEFLQLPETKPASEYINGTIIQKPMPKGRHSRLQGKICTIFPGLDLELTPQKVFSWLKMQ